MRDIVQQNFLKNQNIIRLKKDFFKRIEDVRYMQWFQYKNLKSWKETADISRLVTNTASYTTIGEVENKIPSVGKLFTSIAFIIKIVEVEIKVLMILNILLLTNLIS